MLSSTEKNLIRSMRPNPESELGRDDLRWLNGMELSRAAWLLVVAARYWAWRTGRAVWLK